MLRFVEIQERLDKGGSYQLEALKLLCEIADTLLDIKKSLTQEVIPKQRGRPLKKGWNNLSNVDSDITIEAIEQETIDKP